MLPRVVSFRPAIESDYPLIFSSFLRSYRGTFPVSMIPDRQYFLVFHGLMELWLASKTVVMAVLESDPDEIFGWLAGSTNELLYCYVKRGYRRLGIASALFHNMEKTTHSLGRNVFYIRLLTEAGRHFIDNLGKTFKYLPGDVSPADDIAPLVLDVDSKKGNAVESSVGSADPV